MMSTNEGYPAKPADFKGCTILITGGSGSWGNELTRQLLEEKPLYSIPDKIIIFSRGEIAQVAMQRKFNDNRIKYVIGDVRDREAVEQVFRENKIHYVFHLAALKHVPICENQPQEAIRTNIIGTSNMLYVSAKYKIRKFIYVSTDKAVDPINLYGMTKGIGERLVTQANCASKDTEFLCIRAGNVLGTNGSLVHHVINQIKSTGYVTLTDDKMTRYFLTQKKAIQLLFFAVEEGIGGEIYVMNMPSFYIKDLIDVLIEHYGPLSRIKEIGPREGEKIHEALISPSEVSRTRYINENYHVIYPQLETGRTYFHIWDHMEFAACVALKSSFTSNDNLKDKEFLLKLLKNGGFLDD